MRRLLVVLGALFAFMLVLPTVVILPAAGAQEETTPAAEPADAPLDRTNIRYISPFTPDGLNPDLTVAETEEAVCGFPSADVLDRPDAWDCISESDVVYDPCFENPFVMPDAPGQMACFDSPFSTDVVVLTLTEPLDRDKGMDDPAPDADPGPGPGAEPDGDYEPWDLPWALELANGEQCTLFGGTLTVVAGQVAHYGCTGGGMVLGQTDRSEPVWVVSYIAEGGFATTLAQVATAWS